MSFLNDIIGIGKDIYKTVTSNSIGGTLARTALLGLVVNQINKSVNKENDLPNSAKLNEKDRFVREQLSPDANHSVPVVYGDAYIKGIITDAIMTDSNGVMWYCVTICEKTGTLLSTSADSVISFKKIYLNNCEVTFQSDGQTVASITDADGNTNTDVAGLVKFYCYNNGSNSPTLPEGYTNPSLLFARDVFPGWTVNHAMTNLVFVIVKVTYSKEKNVISLGDLDFKLNNTLTLPGDVMYDYMTNTRYGAGIDPAEIYSV